MSICFGVAKGPLATSSTFWCRCISLISPIPCNDPYDGSHYIRHSILYPNGTSAFRLADFPFFIGHAGLYHMDGGWGVFVFLSHGL